MEKEKDIHIIGAATGWGGRRRGAEHGPEALQKFGLLDKLQDAGLVIDWPKTVKTTYSKDDYARLERDETLPYILEFSDDLAHAVTNTLDARKFPLVLGGDHSVALASWSSLITHLNLQENFGLIWIDAHLDAHTPETASQGRWGGMYHGRPVAVLQGYGEDELVDMCAEGPKISSSHICLLGARSFEEGEAALLERNGVRVIGMEEVVKRGFEDCWMEALDIATAGTEGFGLSIDLDAFDPEAAPGVATREKNGLQATDVLETLAGAGFLADLKALEIVEYNPERDSDDKTAQLVEKLILSIFHGDT